MEAFCSRSARERESQAECDVSRENGRAEHGANGRETKPVHMETSVKASQTCHSSASSDIVSGTRRPRGVDTEWLALGCWLRHLSLHIRTLWKIRMPGIIVEQHRGERINKDRSVMGNRKNTMLRRAGSHVHNEHR